VNRKHEPPRLQGSIEHLTIPIVFANPSFVHPISDDWYQLVSMAVSHEAIRPSKSRLGDIRLLGFLPLSPVDGALAKSFGDFVCDFIQFALLFAIRFLE
jgi:hypothetical protein